MYKRNKKIACSLSLIMVLNNVSMTRISVYAMEKQDNSINLIKEVKDINIVSNTSISAEDAKRWATKKNATREFIDLADLFWKYAPSHGGVNPALAYVQAALETGYGRFGGVLDESYYNTCGLKNTDAGTSDDDTLKDAHKVFDNWSHGVQAHLDHLALYAGAYGYPKSDILQKYQEEKLNPNFTYDPRHFKDLYGLATTAQKLTNNWAGSGYGDKLINLYDSLLSEYKNGRRGWFVNENNQWIYYNENGRMHKGWLQLPDGRYYLNEKGIMTTGWHEEEGKKYYFDIYGRGVIGKTIEIEGKKYTFNSNGQLEVSVYTGWKADENYNWHYYDADGRMHKGWLQLPDGRYYLNEKGIMTTGWHEEEGKKYYFDIYGRGVIGKTIKIGVASYSFDSNGVLQIKQGWHHNENYNWYYLNEHGIAHIGWLTLSDGTYYFNNDGFMIKGWLTEEENRYYFNEYGRRVSGFLDNEGLKYYFNGSGIAQKGWHIINGKEYYFYNDYHAAQFEFINGKYIGYDGYVKDKMTIVIDPGHNNGGDSGANYVHDGIVYDETQMNMDVAVKLRDALLAQGYNVIMTRQPGEIQTDKLSQSLLKRVIIANNEKADLFISIHHDSYNATSNGMTIFYDTYRPNVETNGVKTDSDGNDYDTTPCRAAIVSKEFTADLAKNLPSSLGLYNRGARYRNFYVTRNTIMPSMLIECGFISNPDEAKKLADPLHQLKMAGELTTNINKLYRR